MKICRGCDRELPIEAFSFNKSKNQLHYRCKECNKQYQREHYTRNRDVYLKKEVQHRKAHSERNFQALISYLSEHPCVGCGETDPVVLDFDHRDPNDKSYTISAAMNKRHWDSLLIEIEKCDVRCANCHRRRTARQMGWRKALLASTI